jgi:hypothetical protein
MGSGCGTYCLRLDGTDCLALACLVPEALIYDAITVPGAVVDCRR